jgi:HEPN domain-containing protein
MSDRDPEALAVAREWIGIAEEDLAAARALLDAITPSARAVCFHAQQAVEKYFKAVLVANGTPFGKTHDIGELIRLLPPGHRPPLTPETTAQLTRSAVATRYPEVRPPSRGDAEHLLRQVVDVREFVRTILPSEVFNP